MATRGNSFVYLFLGFLKIYEMLEGRFPDNYFTSLFVCTVVCDQCCLKNSSGYSFLAITCFVTVSSIFPVLRPYVLVVPVLGLYIAFVPVLLRLLRRHSDADHHSFCAISRMLDRERWLRALRHLSVYVCVGTACHACGRLYEMASVYS